MNAAGPARVARPSPKVQVPPDPSVHLTPQEGGHVQIVPEVREVRSVPALVRPDRHGPPRSLAEERCLGTGRLPDGTRVRKRPDGTSSGGLRLLALRLAP